MISLFSVLDFSAFHLFISNFRGRYRADLSVFFYKHYDGFTICHIPNFLPSKVSARYLRKKLQLSDFLEGKRYKFCPNLKVSLEMLRFSL